MKTNSVGGGSVARGSLMFSERNFLNSLILAGVLTTCAHSVEIEWIEQWGDAADQDKTNIFADSLGYVYQTGRVRVGIGSGFINKYDATGDLQWSRMGPLERGQGVSADAFGNVFITGTDTSISSTFSIFINKYNTAGNLQWSQQLDSNNSDTAENVSTDELGNIYVTGNTDGDLGGINMGGLDAFLAKYDTNGTLQWIRQWDYFATDVAADGLGNVYVSGGAGGSPSLDSFDTAGNLQWSQQLPTSFINAQSVTTDGLGGVYIAGKHINDATFVAKYNDSGDLQWIRGFSSLGFESGIDIAADGLGNVLISGKTSGNIGGQNAGGPVGHAPADAFLVNYDASGNFKWAQQLGTSGLEFNFNVSVDGLGNAYIGGQTSGDLGGPNGGSWDAVLAKYINLNEEPEEPWFPIFGFPDVPEPSTFTLATFALLGLAYGRRREAR